MNAKAATCPPEEVLADFGLGKLDERATETINAHLETCLDCRELVSGISGDSFLNRLREAHGQAPANPDPSPARLERTIVPGESLASAQHRSETLTSRPAVEPKPAADLVIPPELMDNPDYEVLKELGRGGMGVVYLARNRAMDRLEVLKVVNKRFLDKPGALERFQQEIRSAAKLLHANIVAAHSVPRLGDLLVFAMEYVDGQDLPQVVKQRGRLPVTNATFYIQQAALGLQHAFEKGMVHRDIKPNNLMLAIENKKHVVKILDFGLAKATSEKAAEGGLTQTGQILGTPDYIAPEQTLAAQKADIRADIYSLGCTLYYLLAGHVPFHGASLYEILQAHHQTEAQALNLVRADVPAELAAVVAKMMAKDPAKRYQTPLEVAKALNPFFKAGGQAAVKSDLPPSVSPGIAPILPPVAALPIPVAVAQPAVPMATPLSAAPLDSFAEAERPRPKPRKKVAARRRRLGPLIAIGLLLVGGFIAAAVIFKFRTADGVVVVEVNEPNPEIFIDGDKATVTWDGVGTKAEITLPAGTHRIQLKKDGFTASGETVEIATGDRRTLAARLERTPGATASASAPLRPVTKTAPPASTKPEPEAVPAVAHTTPVAAPSPAPGATGSDSVPALAIAPFDARQARAHQEAWAKHLGVPVEQKNSIGMSLVLIPPGEFLMGSTPEQNALGRKMAEDVKTPSHASFIGTRLETEVPQHRATLATAYRMGMTELTIGQFRMFVDATKYVTEAEQFGFGNSNPAKPDAPMQPEQKNLNWRTPGYVVTDDSPVTQVTWNDAVQFCNWLSDLEKSKPCYRRDSKEGWALMPSGTGYRLPTEAEWEFACRAGTTTQFSFGDVPAMLDSYGWCSNNSGKRARDVGLKIANAFGLFDMHGNVYEWCHGLFAGDYNSKSTSSPNRMCRGGSWNFYPVGCRSAYRDFYAPAHRYFSTGFRVMRVSVGGGTGLDARGAGASATPGLPGSAPPPVAANDGFVPLFNGRDLAGWRTLPEQPGNWRVENGVLIGSGPATSSNLFSDRGDFENFHLRLETRLNAGGNSGVYFRAAFGLRRPANNPKWVDGYEAQINSENKDTRKTGSLMASGDTLISVEQSPIPPNQWFQLEIIADANHLAVKVDGKSVAACGDPGRRFTIGHIVLQQLYPETVVEFRKIEVRDLTGAKAPTIAKADPIADRLDKAKATYQDKLEKLKDGLLKSLDKKEAAARAAGDKTTLEKIQQERTDLTANGAIPTVVPASDYARQLRAGRAQLESAYGVAIKAYTKAKQDDQAAAADRELAEFRRHTPHPADAKEFAGKFYKVFDQKISWHEAQAACVEMGGHLVIVKTPEENAFLVRIKGPQGVWLGATDEAVKGEWTWVDGSRVTYTNWAAKQPNPSLGEHYLELSLPGQWSDRWDRVDEFQPGFICQWD